MKHTHWTNTAKHSMFQRLVEQNSAPRVYDAAAGQPFTFVDAGDGSYTGIVRGKVMADGTLLIESAEVFK